MKGKFYRHLPTEDGDFDKIWDDAIIVFDANALLNLYRYSPATRKDFVKVLDGFSEQIWISYQASYEFYTNRMTVIKSHEDAYGEIIRLLEQDLRSIEGKLNKYNRHPSIAIGSILDSLKDAQNQIIKELSVKRKRHPNYSEADEILKDVLRLFDGKTGEKFSYEELEEIYKEGSERYKKKIPPGFSDLPGKKNTNNQNLYGDLIIWKEIIRCSIDSQKPIIFVTDDRKKDWWQRKEGKLLGPREELLIEFNNETNFQILIYQADSFLRIAEKKLEEPIELNSIEEVEDLRIEEEIDELNFLKNTQSVDLHLDWMKTLYPNVPKVNWMKDLYPDVPKVDWMKNLYPDVPKVDWMKNLYPDVPKVDWVKNLYPDVPKVNWMKTLYPDVPKVDWMKNLYPNLPKDSDDENE